MRSINPIKNFIRKITIIKNCFAHLSIRYLTTLYGDYLSIRYCTTLHSRLSIN